MALTSIQQHKRMTETPIPRLVASLAIPTTVSQLITVVSPVETEVRHVLDGGAERADVALVREDG